MALYVGGTSLLLHGNGADGSTVFTDETGKTVTAYGNARISTAQSKFGGSSMYFDGVGDYLRVSGGWIGFNTSDFTMEAWVQPNLSHIGYILSGRFGGTNGITFRTYEGKIQAFYGGGYGSVMTTSNSLISGTWTHVAVVRASGTMTVYLNGVADGAISWSGIDLDSSTLEVGAWNNAEYFNGYIADIRIVKGVALYRENFTPPTAQLEVIPPITVAIQAHDPGITKLAKYDPSQIKPFISEVTTDLQDRMPYGLWKTPTVFNEFKGRGRITGTVKNTPGTPVFRQVRLHREPDGMFVKAVWSDPVTGAYEFNGVKPDVKYTVTSYDHTQAFRAAIADRVIPDALP